MGGVGGKRGRWGWGKLGGVVLGGGGGVGVLGVG